MRWVGHVARMGERTGYTEFWWETLGRLKRRLKDNIKTDLQEVGCGGIDWIELA